MKEAVELNIKGIKCDTCDYVNTEIESKDYEKWINKACPKCGAVLLTQEDYDSSKILEAVVKMVNGMLPGTEDDDEERVSMSVKMNGTGKIELELDK